MRGIVYYVYYLQLACSHLSANRQLVMETNDRRPPGALIALGLLLAINLFNYIDRQVLAAVEPQIRETFFATSDRNAMAITGVLGTAFLVTYMLAAPALGWLSDRFSRWIIIGAAVMVWSLASGASGLAATFGALLITRIFVGIGEGGYGPAAPTVLADLFSLQTPGRVMGAFCAAVSGGRGAGYFLRGLVFVTIWVVAGG